MRSRDYSRQDILSGWNVDFWWLLLLQEARKAASRRSFEPLSDPPPFQGPHLKRGWIAERMLYPLQPRDPSRVCGSDHLQQICRRGYADIFRNRAFQFLSTGDPANIPSSGKMRGISCSFFLLFTIPAWYCCQLAYVDEDSSTQTWQRRLSRETARRQEQTLSVG